MLENFQVVIVGTGIAGLYCALQFDDDVNVLLISKKQMEISNSYLAQGGVAAAVNQKDSSFKLHIKDTIIAGQYKNNLSSVEKLVYNGPNEVFKLKNMGVAFNTDEKGKLLTTLEGGHSENRIVYHKDSTGKEITSVLIKRVKEKPNIKIIENSMVYSIDKVKKGFSINVLKDNKKINIKSEYCVLATGGIGGLYMYSTNASTVTGDGIAIAYELGAKISHLSRIQFHPTGFTKKGREKFLISESVRGEGGYLLNSKGERFLFNYTKLGELAPRDIVSEAIIKESKKVNSEKFYIDISHKDSNFIKKRFPTIYNECLKHNIDITKDKIPVFPCQHYLMGGIKVNLNSCTTIKNLYAIGECANTGVHGGNRLASNSLLEALVFSKSAAEHISLKIKNEKLEENYIEKTIKNKANNKHIKNNKEIDYEILNKIRKIMQESYFVLPNKEKININYRKIKNILKDILQGNYKITYNYIEAKSLAINAYLILKELKENINL